jgi:alpha-mannosidase
MPTVVGPVRTTLRVVVPGAPRHIARISLLAGVDRVEIENRITQNFGAVTGYDFEFALGPDFVARHEEVGMIAHAARAAEGGDYADGGTRTDYLTLNHFVDLSEAEVGVTLSS